jgi:glycosyltransferase involved in cell wall biosynthesis
VLYAYLGYPLLLWLVSRGHKVRPIPVPPTAWPTVSITIPVYNEEAIIGGTLERALAVDYPPERRQILVVSDASTDRTDEIVRRFATRGVQLLRLPVRAGKTAAENAARQHLRGEIIVNTDASIVIDRQALKALVAHFDDPSVGVASGRDISVAHQGESVNVGEWHYVGYEMGVRALETRISGIVGASGCLYAIRSQLHMTPLPEVVSRDFAAALVAREHGYRAVSVADARCYVSRALSLRREYRRKVRTMVRGLMTLLHKRRLLNPFRYGAFAWMLFSHKLCRWVVPWALVGATGALVALAPGAVWPRGALVVGGFGSLAGVVGWLWPEGRRPPRLVSLPAFFLVTNLAALHAWINLCRGQLNPIWEPTRRQPAASP